MGTESHRGADASSSDRAVGETTVSCKHIAFTPPSPPPRPRVNIRASIFFDGTCNNRNNTDGINLAPFVVPGLQDSYSNEWTNVAKLEMYIQTVNSPANHAFSIYIEGIGTVNYDNDEIRGMSLGMGPTGVEARVNDSISRIITRIGQLGDRNIDTIHLDAFGFSRGAAAARHFIYKVLFNERHRLRDRLIRRGYTVNNVTVNFIGLFDTVAAHGGSHSNDTRTLQLDAIRHAQRVVQLASADEHRENFPLTNIDAAGSSGLQIFLPGTHSDIGGGYVDHSEEVGLRILSIPNWSGLPMVQSIITARLADERRRLIDTGWYVAANFHTYTGDNTITITRRGTRDRYNRIPLHLMASLAGPGGLAFSSSLQARNPIPAELNTVNAEVNAYIAGLGVSTINDWNRNTPQLRDLRHRYLHFSAHYDTLGIYDPHFTLRDDRINGVRRRVIYDG